MKDNLFFLLYKREGVGLREQIAVGLILDEWREVV